MEEHSKRTSVVWNYFTAVDDAMATCDICSMRLSYKSTVSNLKKHINRKHPDAIRPGGNGATASGRADDEYYAVNTPTVKSGGPLNPRGPGLKPKKPYGRSSLSVPTPTEKQT